MPKVVHILPGKANPDRLNGVNKVVSAIAAQAFQTGHNVEVWGISADTDASPQHIFPFQLFKGDTKRFVVPYDLQQAILGQAAGTCFHLHGALIPLYYSITRLLHTHGYRYIVTPHGALLKRSLRRGWWYKYIYAACYERTILRQARFIHCITRIEKDELAGLCKNLPVKIIPNGTFYRDPPQRPKPHDEPVFLYMGRFDKRHKGLDILLKAFAIFRQSSRGQLILMGEGPDHGWLNRAITDLHLQSCVQIVPPHYGADKDAMLERCDIFVHASRWDVMPTGCLEAAAHGKPLIIPKATGLSTYIRDYHAGWITLSRHPSELAQKFNLAAKSWRKGQSFAIGQQANAIIHDKLRWDVIVPKFYQALYPHD